MKTNSLGSGPVNLNQAQPTAPVIDSQASAPTPSAKPNRSFSTLKKIASNPNIERIQNASGVAVKKSQAPSAQPNTLAELPSELIGHIGNNLHLSRDLAALSIASKAAKNELNGSLNVLKRLSRHKRLILELDCFTLPMQLNT